jgi:hypothetical protein
VPVTFSFLLPKIFFGRAGKSGHSEGFGDSGGRRRAMMRLRLLIGFPHHRAKGLLLGEVVAQIANCGFLHVIGVLARCGI